MSTTAHGQPANRDLDGAARRAIIAFVRSVVERAARAQDVAQVRAAFENLEAPYGGVFVTLRRLDRLRGCIGCLDARLPLEEALRRAARDSALYDPRFSPLKVGELPDVRISVSILSEPRDTQKPLEDMTLGTHGVIVERGDRRGLFLPQVARDHGLDKGSFLSRCCTEKAGLPADAWRDPATRVRLFTTVVIEEEGFGEA